MRSNRWSKSETGGLWLPQPSRRTILSGAVGGVALLLGCGSEKPAKTDGGDAGREGGADTGGPGGMEAGVDGHVDAGQDLALEAGQDLAPDAGQDLAPDVTQNLVRDAREDVVYDLHPETASLECTERAQQIVGPYPAPGVQLERSDIRSDPGDNGLVKPGAPLRVVIRVGSKGDAGCRPLHGAVVNAWQCDATGQYASYTVLGTGMNMFLRGYQLTDASGVVEFQTIYPGSYPGRTVHIHFAVRERERELVADLPRRRLRRSAVLPRRRHRRGRRAGAVFGRGPDSERSGRLLPGRHAGDGVPIGGPLARGARAGRVTNQLCALGQRDGVPAHVTRADALCEWDQKTSIAEIVAESRVAVNDRTYLPEPSAGSVNSRT
jgi:hypothetical protein